VLEAARGGDSPRRESKRDFGIVLLPDVRGIPLLLEKVASPSSGGKKRKRLILGGPHRRCRTSATHVSHTTHRRATRRSSPAERQNDGARSQKVCRGDATPGKRACRGRRGSSVSESATPNSRRRRCRRSKRSTTEPKERGSKPSRDIMSFLFEKTLPPRGGNKGFHAARRGLAARARKRPFLERSAVEGEMSFDFRGKDPLRKRAARRKKSLFRKETCRQFLSSLSRRDVPSSYSPSLSQGFLSSQDFRAFLQKSFRLG